MAQPFTIAILSGKGGVGKTTISLNLARELSRFTPVWLVDMDLFNRGSTSALWESERGIPLSVAALVLGPADPVNNDKHLLGEDEVTRARAYATELNKHKEALAYDRRLYFLPAARATEGRAASYLLWEGFSDTNAVASATAFLESLITAIGETTPGCLVILDGHGGLDELSLGAADVSDICFIVNEPDLITFTGSLTLYREIRETHSKRPLSIEFIINRVAPNRDVTVMERDFGDVLSSISSGGRAVAAYFPLERELFGVFGDDPFVYEIYTRFWFSRKIRMLAASIVERAIEARRIPSSTVRDPLPGAANYRIDVGDKAMRMKLERKRNRVRRAVRREFYKRGDLLLTWWFGFSTFAAIVLYLGVSFIDTFRAVVLALGSLGAGTALVLLIQTIRWTRMQTEHVMNASRIRATPGRRLRFGDARAAELRMVQELDQGKRLIGRKLQWAALLFVFLVGVSIIAVPKIIRSAALSKQTRTMAAMRVLATATEAFAVDYNTYIAVDNVKQLRPFLQPTYIKEMPVSDEWGTEFRYFPGACLSDSKPYEVAKGLVNPHVCQAYSFVSAGADKNFEHELASSYKEAKTSDFDADLVFSNGSFVRSPETVPSKPPLTIPPKYEVPPKASAH